MKNLRRSLAAFAAVCLMAAAAFAADPSGTYTFAGGGRGGKGGGAPAPGATPPMNTLVLALKDGKLTGSLTSPARGGGEPTKTDISDASVKDDSVSFSVTTQGQNGPRTVKYTGKISADAITGQMIAPGRNGGEPMPADWVAKKAAK